MQRNFEKAINYLNYETVQLFSEIMYEELSPKVVMPCSSKLSIGIKLIENSQ